MLFGHSLKCWEWVRYFSIAVIKFLKEGLFKLPVNYGREWWQQCRNLATERVESFDYNPQIGGGRELELK